MHVWQVPVGSCAVTRLFIGGIASCSTRGHPRSAVCSMHRYRWMGGSIPVRLAAGSRSRNRAGVCMHGRHEARAQAFIHSCSTQPFTHPLHGKGKWVPFAAICRRCSSTAWLVCVAVCCNAACLAHAALRSSQSCGAACACMHARMGHSSSTSSATGATLISSAQPVTAWACL